jgi:hypothetical protein
MLFAKFTVLELVAAVVVGTLAGLGLTVVARVVIGIVLG